MARNDFKEIAEDVIATPMNKAVNKLLTFLGLGVIIWLTFIISLHTDIGLTISMVLSFVLMFAIYWGRKDMYGHTTTNKHK